MAHWIETGCAVRLSPLQTHLEAALRQLAGLRVTTYRQDRHGDSVFMVNVDAKVYRVLDAYEQHLALGDLSLQSMGQLLDSPSYRQRLVRDEQAFAEKCSSCEFLGACSGGFIHDSRTAVHPGKCPSAYACIQFIQRYIEEQGYGRDEILALLHQVSSEGEQAA